MPSFVATVGVGIGGDVIAQVTVEVIGLLQHQARIADNSPFAWPNLRGFLGGIQVLYLTASPVK